VHICWSVCTQACCINRNCNPQHNLLLNPKAIAQTRATDWNQASSWKQVLNNLRLVIQPSVILNLLQPWLNLFPFRDYQQG